MQVDDCFDLDFAKVLRAQAWRDRISAPITLDVRRAIRGMYTDFHDDIAAAGPREWGVDPYIVDWPALFTAIEYALWCDIRAAGIVMYPQYPVLGYFVDFGNPCARVAIECDGRAYHQDRGADWKRQREIEAQGWTVYRITGRDCLSDFDPDERAFGESQKFIDRIARAHNLYPGGGQ